MTDAPTQDAEIETSNYLKHTSGNQVQRRLIDRFHRAITAQVVALRPRTLLDAGCGEGFVAEVFLGAMPDLELTGIDFNPDAVALAARRNPGATFETASLLDLPFAADSFQVVCCFEVLEHQTDPDVALRELVRVSREWVILSVPHEPLFCLANVARGKNLAVRPRGSDPDHRQFWTRRGFGAWAGRELDIKVLSGSFPWTICVGRKRSSQ